MASIEVLKTVRPELRWTPTLGDQTLDFCQRKCREMGLAPANGLDPVLEEAQTILGRCVPPTEKGGKDTGLVVGYVQSGKTLSFTTVMALARDNGYQLVIVIAGIAINLKSQSEGRLLKDLGLDDGNRAWAHFENPDPTGDDVRNIDNILSGWKRDKVPSHKRRTVLITVLKHHTRLRKLVAVLKRLKLDGVPTLIIDDEADQASLNTSAAANKKSGGSAKSPTYDWITQLKAVLPHHTFLQYTATPQANLLLHLAEVLSPSFAELVTPGDGYAGGRDFFKSTPSLVTVIPEKEIPSANQLVTSPPPSLQSAARYFLLGSAAHYLLKNQRGNRSMMIHPSQKTAPHADYKDWVQRSVESWRQLLERPSDSEDFKAGASLFEPEYNSLKGTHPSLPAFDDLMGVMAQVIAEVRILQVNSTKQGQKNVKWKENAYWIIVGGQKLDRGFTVEGLTVTYMPRPIGTGNADTLQQRARFFGYKKAYKGLCRVFVPRTVYDAFREYLEHEEFVREALQQFRGRPLLEWKRDFILTRWLSPTRPSVISRDIERVNLDAEWIIPGRLYKDEKATTDNQKLFADLRDGWVARHGSKNAAEYAEFKDNRGVGSPRNILIENVPLRDVLEKFLLQVRTPDYEDSTQLTAVALALQIHLQKEPESLCDVVLVGEMEPQRRSLTKTGRINQAFSGKSPNVPEIEKQNYVGDAALYTGRPTLHLRKYNLGENKDAPVTYASVPWFTLRLPADYVKDSVIEPGVTP